MAYLHILAVVFLAASCHGASDKIIGGTPTTIETYPYIVSVESRFVVPASWEPFCVASILNEWHLLSAAQCFAGPYFSPNLRRFRAGSQGPAVGGQVAYLNREFNHPSYAVASGFDADISVLRLASPLTFTDSVQPGTIPAPNAFIPDNSSVIHAGWGIFNVEGDFSPVLRDIQIYTINRDVCQQRYSHEIITSNMICTGVLDVEGRVACRGDSGSPLYFGSSHVIIGVASWGYGCAHPFYPGVSAAVSPFTEWILSIAQDP